MRLRKKSNLFVPIGDHTVENIVVPPQCLVGLPFDPLWKHPIALVIKTVSLMACLILPMTNIFETKLCGCFSFLQGVVICSELPKMPNITITLHGKDFVLTPNDYVLKVSEEVLHHNVCLCLSCLTWTLSFERDNSIIISVHSMRTYVFIILISFEKKNTILYVFPWEMDI